MKHFIFMRESNDFSDILNDNNIKSHIYTTITFTNYLIIGVPENNDLDKVTSYIVLKYGEELKDFKNVVGDRSPIPYVDYLPKKRLKDGHYVDNF